MIKEKFNRRPSRAALAAVLAAGLAAALPAHATNGYFSHGYGLQSKGMGGAATASTQDAFGGANNPATMVWVGNRFDVGVDWFSPRRQAERTGSNLGIDFSADSDSRNFLIPELGYNRLLSPTLSLGVTVYGNGGMNTDYAGGRTNCAAFGGSTTANGLCGNGRLGVDLTQLIIAPTLAWKFHDRHSIGVSPLFAYQRFRAEGLQMFQGMSGSPANVTNRGYDDSTGWGVRVGYLGRLTDRLSVGAAYSSKIRMGKFDKYRGLFADQGDFDIPENWNVGVSFAVSPQLSVALDYQFIRYSGVPAVSNASTVALPLGASGGPGFGWQDVAVYKLGVQWRQSERLTLRAGYNHGDNPIRARDVTFNILAPGVVQDHLTAGATWTMDGGSELTVAYMHAMRKSVSGSSYFNGMPLPPGVTAGNEKIQMYENSLGVAWGTRF